MITIAEKIKNHALEAEAVWGKAYGLIGRVIQERKLSVGAEIGVAFGGHSESILKVPTVVRLYGVDPYQHNADYIDAMNLPQEEFDELYKFTTARLSQFDDRYQHIRKSSQQAVDEIPEELDFVYIDADHSYSGVWEDLCVWFGKVRVGGIIGGHDYDHPDFPGVKKAIDEFFRRFDWKINVEGEGVWWVEIRKLQISFIMPAFNCEGTVQESIESIMKGNFSEGDELIVVNDGSIDNTKGVLNELAKKYPQITILEHKRNRGGGAARNTAVENARNPILFCLDSDNLLVSNSINPLKQFLVNSGPDIASFQELCYFTNGDSTKITHKWVFSPGEITLADCLANPVVPGASGNYMFTKESWARAGGYPEFNFLDTWGFGFRQLATGSKMAVMPESYYHHRYGHESYWVRESKKNNVSLLAMQILIPFLNLINDKDVDYMMSRKGRYVWFDNLDERPIRVKDIQIGIAGRIEDVIPSISRFKKLRGRIKKIIKQVLHPVFEVANKISSQVEFQQEYWRFFNLHQRGTRFKLNWKDRYPILNEKTENVSTRSYYINSPVPNESELHILFSNKRPLIIFDIGACEGEDSIRYSKLFPNAKIFAFEPLPHNVEMIKSQLVQYNRINVEVFQIALADQMGEVDFFVSSGQADESISKDDWDFGNKSSSLLPPHKNKQELFPWLKFSEKIKVSVTTLEIFCAQHELREIDFIHLDVQGAELKVLAGAGDLLKKIHAIWLEVESVLLYEGQPLKHDVEMFMKEHGFVNVKDATSDVSGDQFYVNTIYLRKHPFISLRFAIKTICLGIRKSFL